MVQHHAHESHDDYNLNKLSLSTTLEVVLRLRRCQHGMVMIDGF
jgi:hypothetical protein